MRALRFLLHRRRLEAFFAAAHGFRKRRLRRRGSGFPLARPSQLVLQGHGWPGLLWRSA